MTPSREEWLFGAALALTPEERAAFLDRECGDDHGLRERVLALLRASEGAPSFIDEPVVESLATEKAGELIDRYKLLQKIGEGGCGIVWMAGQEEPVRRRVALKVIKLGMDTKSVVARFEAERQALALMDHPNIARVFDGGATRAGRPYFVMELVRGVSITKYCDEQNLPTEARLALFSQVCQAVQHAHQKGIIHRDLKPSNVLVTVNDGIAVPKVIDFGIAKATQGRLTDQTLFTAFEQFIGTPAYMSPEQAELTSLDVDTRSDIYSLGVLLYELLTGRTPFDSGSLLKAGLDEIRRVIREVEPPRPSARLSTLTDADRATVAKMRAIAPAQLSTLLRGDLDWIVMRCLEKDRRRRYDTANGLAMDLQRYLHHEPVAARPPSAAYRLQKFARRHRLALSAAGAILLTLLIALAQSTRSYLREKSARTAEAVAHALAEERRVEVEIINRFLVSDVLGAADPANSRGRDVTMRETLDNAARQVPYAFKGRPRLEAAVRHAIGNTYVGLSLPTQAEPHLRYALEQRRQLLGDDHPDTLLSRHAVGRLQRLQLDARGAEKTLREVMQAQARVLGPAHAQTLDTFFDLGLVMALLVKNDELLPEARRNWELSRAEHGADHRSTLRVQHVLIGALWSTGNRAEAANLLLDLIEAQKRTLGPEHPDTVASVGSYGIFLETYAPPEQTESILRDALAVGRKLYGDANLPVASIQIFLASFLHAQKRSAEGEAVLREAVEAARNVAGPPPSYSLLVVQQLWSSLSFENRHADAATVVRDWLRHVDQVGTLAGAFPASARVSCMHMLGRSLNSLEQYPEAETVLREVLTIRERDFANDYRRWGAQADVAGSLVGQRRYAEAEPLLLAAFKGLEQFAGKMPNFRGPSPLESAAAWLVRLYTESGQPDKAGAWKDTLAKLYVPPEKKGPAAR